MSGTLDIRRGTGADAAICAAIKNAWIDGTDWMPRVHPADDVARHYRDVVFPNREVFVSGEPVSGFLSFDAEDDEVTALFVADRGQGRGKALLDHVKARTDTLKLWTFEANVGARRFYAREDFHQIARTEGENEEGLPDVLLQWSKVGGERT